MYWVMKSSTFQVAGWVVDVVGRTMLDGIVLVKNGFIEDIIPCDTGSNCYLLPGFIDAHIHVESSLLTPSSFAKIALSHGTIASVSDPHEIANVLGVEGVRYMIRNGESVPFKFCFGVPSCVPATIFEASGAVLNKEHVEELFIKDGLSYLSEMMNYPGVVNGELSVCAKLDLAKRLGVPVDGHAPGLTGDALKKYVSSGISTDHECFTLVEAFMTVS